MFEIDTFASRFGLRRTAGAAAAALVAAYACAVALPLALPGRFRAGPMSAGHAALLAYFLLACARLRAAASSSAGQQQQERQELDRIAFRKFYKVIWNLFYLEYLLYPFI